MQQINEKPQEDNTTTNSDAPQSLICHITNIYPNNYNSIEDVHIPRYNEISKRFSKLYGKEVQYFVRVPGVINIMGDPIKLYGYTPLSMSLDQDIIFAFSTTDKNQIIIQNSQSALFPTLTISNEIQQKFDEENTYLNLLLAGYKAALQESFVSNPKGLLIFISSNLPTKNGLYSSSSLILAMCFTTLISNNLIKKTYQTSLLENLIKYEKLIHSHIQYSYHFSTMLYNKSECGYFADNNKLIEFPKKYNFIIANTLTPTPTLYISGQRQNKRLTECRIGLYMMMKKLDMKDFANVKNLKDFQEILGYGSEDMIQLLKDSVEPKTYKIEEIEQFFETTLIKLIADIPYAEKVVESNKVYNPFERCLHIFSENLRIEKLLESLDIKDKKEDEKAEELAKMFNESYQSQKENFECVSEECDNLRKIMINYGVLGCRLASDGWGGSLIGISPISKSSKIIEFLMNDYYLDPKNKIYVSDDLNMLVFQSNGGASLKSIDPQYEIWF